jgi:DNA-binding SARP family transcriptional activator
VANGDARLAEALSLIELGSFGAAADALARVAESRSPSVKARVDAACELCRAGEAHRQAAAELDAAASQQRASALQVQRRLMTLLSGTGASGGQAGGRSKTLRDRFRRLRGSARPPTVGIGTRSDRPLHDESSASPDERSTIVSAPLTASSAAPPTAIELVGAPAPAVVPDADVVARVLGPLELTVLGREIREWGGSKGRSLLQYLLLSGSVPVRRETLMELLWPDHPHGSARNNLNVALYGLRRAAFPSRPGGGPFIEHHQGAYMLGRRTSWSIDRDAFLDAWNTAAAAHGRDDFIAARSAYERAAALYRGRLFEDDPNGEWFLAEQRLLEERFLLVLERLASLQMASRELESAVATLHRALSRDACRESAHRLLMQCFADLHQHQLVTRQFHLCVDALDHELSVQPHPETVRLFHGLTRKSE